MKINYVFKKARECVYKNTIYFKKKINIYLNNNIRDGGSA